MPLCDIYGDVAETVSAARWCRVVRNGVLLALLVQAEPFIINSCKYSLQPAVTKITIMTTAKRFSGAPTKRRSGAD